ncbi:MAG: hypothetical protein ACRDRT_03620 [Pseudonocardiaceae bacterium]
MARPAFLAGDNLSRSCDGVGVRDHLDIDHFARNDVAAVWDRRIDHFAHNDVVAAVWGRRIWSSRIVP